MKLTSIKHKQVLAAFIYLFICVSAKAQMADYFENSKKIVVLRPTLNSSTISVKGTGSSASTPTARIGYGLGVEYWQKIAKLFYVSGGLHLNSFGYKNVRTNYINTPVIINYLSKSNYLTIGAGLYGGVALSGKYKNSSGSWTKMQYGESATDNRSRTDAGLIINVGISAFGAGHLTSYAYLGLKDLTSNARKDGYTRKMQNWVISFAIPIKEIKKK